MPIVCTVEKIDKNTVKVITTPEVVEVHKTYAELEADLKQAQGSLTYKQSEHAKVEADIQATVDIMQKRLDDAIAAGVIKPVAKVG